MDLSYFSFFFFKQKTAYEMLRSLVGSEMCIRDSVRGSATAGAVSQTDSVAASATHQALTRVEEMVHADSAFDQLPSLRDMLLRPELVQEVYSTVAPGHIPALIDTPIALSLIHI
eukprot:TRINITY_DN20739_c0_g1_i1.p1 TRINITY_DN20739_c0_g1~~TRINITY_DN20739_c0_g1_i1.p1  ORF type:complete len:115 (+),score=42.25 TRINITY_DN20739_c0_g1_i1:94-438(+)